MKVSLYITMLCYTQVDTYTREIRNLENGVKANNIVQDESNTKLGTALSQLSAMEGEKKRLEGHLRMQRGMSDKLERENKKKTYDFQNMKESVNSLRDEVCDRKRAARWEWVQGYLVVG